METSIALSTKLRPSNIRKDSKTCIDLAWDSFGINLEHLELDQPITHTVYLTKISVLMKRKELELILEMMLTRNTPKNLQD